MSSLKKIPFAVLGLYVIICLIFIIMMTLHPFSSYLNPLSPHATRFQLNQTQYRDRRDINFENLEFVFENLRDNYVSEVEHFAQNNYTNQNQVEEVLGILQTTNIYWRDYRIMQDSIERNKSIYMAMWYVNKGRALNQYHATANCYERLYVIVDKYHPLFYYLQLKDIKKMQKIRNDVTRLGNGIVYYDEPPQSIMLLKRNSEGMYDLEDELSVVFSNCEEYLIYMQEDYNYQRRLFAAKLLFVIGVLAVPALIIIKKLLAYFNEFLEQSKMPDGTQEALLWPKKVGDTTVESLLRANLFITPIFTISSLIQQVFGEMNWLMLSLTIIGFLLFALSIVYALGAMNDKNKDVEVREYLAMWSYRFFIVGLVPFVIVVLFLFTSLSAFFVVQAAKDTFTMLVSNSSIYL